MLPGPADLLYELLHAHLVPFLSMGGFPGGFSGDLKAKKGGNPSVRIDSRTEEHADDTSASRVYLLAHLVEGPEQIVEVQMDERVPRGWEGSFEGGRFSLKDTMESLFLDLPFSDIFTNSRQNVLLLARNIIQP